MKKTLSLAALLAASALSLAPFTRQAGIASALMGSWRLGAGGIISAIVSLLHNNTALPMVSMMGICALVSLTLLYVGKATVRYRARKRQATQESSVLM